MVNKIPFLWTLYSHSNFVLRDWGLPWWLRWQRIHLQCRRPRLDPWVRKIPWRREWLPTPVFLPGEFHRLRSQVGYLRKWKLLSHVQLFMTQNTGVGIPFLFLLQGDLPIPGIKPRSPVLQADSLPMELSGKSYLRTKPQSFSLTETRPTHLQHKVVRPATVALGRVSRTCII